MNSSIHLQQLVKWTVPTVAFVFAFFWYKRRRIERDGVQWNDPGGATEEIARNKTREADTNLRAREDNRSAVGCCCAKQQEKEESSRVPGKVGENVPASKNSSFCDSSSSSSSSNNNSGRQNNSADYLEMIDFESQFVSSLELADENLNGDVTNTTFRDVAVDETKQPPHCETGPNYETDKYSSSYDGNRQEINNCTDDAIKIQGQTNERDSANPSPISEVSRGSSSLTDDRSEESMDSGKGSIVPGKSNRHKKDDTAVESTYDFAIPQHLVGRLIGRYGNFLQSIRTKTGVDIYVNDHPCDGDHKICSIQGSVEGINVALKLIRQKFPEKRFPQMTLAEITTAFGLNEIVPTNLVLAPQFMCLTEQVTNDVMISHIVKPSWLFVQLHNHPTNLYLKNLEDNMFYWYNNAERVPMELTRGHFVAVFWSEKWVRGLIEKVDPYGEKNIVRLLDHGGYWRFKSSEYMPLMLEFLQLPCQAIEIFVANIQPSKGGTWSTDAYNLAYQICTNQKVAEAHVVGRIGDNVYTSIYFNIKDYGLISYADELIAQGHAEVVALEDTKPELFESICCT